MQVTLVPFQKRLCLNRFTLLQCFCSFGCSVFLGSPQIIWSACFDLAQVLYRIPFPDATLPFYMGLVPALRVVSSLPRIEPGPRQ